jgi:hypothetical protein
MKSTKINLAKLTLMPVPEGHKIRYIYGWRSPIGVLIFKDIDDRWRRHDGGGLYFGRRILHSCLATLSKADGTFVCAAESFCSKKDAPIKKLGRHIAHNRCIKKFHKSQQTPQSNSQQETVPWDMETIAFNVAASDHAA